MKKNNEIVNVNINTNSIVSNYKQAHNAARNIKVAASTLNQARKALSGIQNEPIMIGRDENKQKLYSTVASFMDVVGCPYKRGQVSLSAILDAWADFLKDEEKSPMLCKNVSMRVKIGKTTYRLYTKDEDGKFHPVSVYKPATVPTTGWDPYKICEGLAQSKFAEETMDACEKSKAAYEQLKKDGNLYVHDTLTDKYIAVKVK